MKISSSLEWEWGAISLSGSKVFSCSHSVQVGQSARKWMPPPIVLPLMPAVRGTISVGIK